MKMRFELPGYDVNYRDSEHHNTPAGKKIEELNKFLMENGIVGGIACLDEKGQVVKRYTDRVVLEIDDFVSGERLEKIKKMVSELLRVMGSTETQVSDVFGDKDVNGVDNIKTNKEGQLKGDKEVMELIKEGKWNFVARHADEFGLDHNEIVNMLMDAGKGQCVIHYRNNFKGVDKYEFIEKILKRGDGAYVLVKSRFLADRSGFMPKIKQNYVDFFDGVVLNQDVAEKLIDNGEPIDADIWVPNLLLDDNHNCLQYFSGIDYKRLALKMIDKGWAREVAAKFYKFKKLDKEVDDRLVEEGCYGYRENPQFKKIFGYDIS